MSSGNVIKPSKVWIITETDSERSFEAQAAAKPQKKRRGAKSQPWYENKSKEFIEGLIQHRMKSFYEDKMKRNGEPEQMTNVTKERIIDAKFDFSALSGCVSDIRKSFWNIERINDFYKKKMKSTHSHFYQKIVPGRTEERDEIARQLKKGGFISALRLVDDDPDEKKLKNKAKNNEVKFDSGSERDSYRPGNDSVHWSDSDKEETNVKVDRDETYNPNVITKQADELTKEMKTKLDAKSPTLRHATSLLDRSSILSSDKSLGGAAAHGDTPSDLSSQMKSNILHMFAKQKTLALGPNAEGMLAEIGLIQKNSMDTVIGAAAAAASKIKRGQTTVLGPPPSNMRKALVTGIKNQVADVKRKSSRRNAQLITKQVQFYQTMTSEEFEAELLSDSDLSRITFALFDKMMKDEDVLKELAVQLSQHLHTKFHRDYSYEEIMAQLPFVDKSLFTNLRDGKITLAQLKARVADKRGFAHYKVLDDIYVDLTEEEKNKIRNQPDLARFLFGKNPKPEDYSKPLEPWQSDRRCIRSIKYHHKKGRAAPAIYSAGTQNQPKIEGGFNSEGGGGTQEMLNNQSREQLFASKDSHSLTRIQRSAHHQSAQPVNSLIDERSVKTKKARQNKEAELRKHTITVNNLKRKLAKQIVSKTSKIEEFKELTLNDLFQHQNDMDKERSERTQNTINIYKIADEQERNRQLNQKWQHKVNGFIQSQVQHYSTNFELNKGLTQEQEELVRLRYKINDPYAYFQEKQNQIQKAYELMAQYKTVHAIEQEIQQAQDYLYKAELYYSNKPQGGRNSPTKDEYSYIKRLVDDGQPVVLSKKIRKALKIQDDMETLDNAIKDDLKAVGFTKEEIEGHQNAINSQEQSEEDSAERRKRKALKEIKGHGAKQEKRVSKKEKARLAYQAERTRQKLLKPGISRPKTGDTSLAAQNPNQQMRQKRQQTAPHRRARPVKAILHTQQLVPTNSDLQFLDNTSDEPMIHTAMQYTRDRTSPMNYQTGSNLGVQSKMIQASSPNLMESGHGKLPKYLSSKLITRNQSNVEQVFLDKLLEADQSNNYAGQIESSAAKRRNVVKGMSGTAAAAKDEPLVDHEPIVLSEQASPPSVSSLQRMMNNQKNTYEAQQSPKRQTKSAFQLRTVKRHYQTSRSVTHHKVQQRPQIGMDEFNEDSEDGDEMIYESNFNNEYDYVGDQFSDELYRPMYRTQFGLPFNNRQQAALENSMSQSMLDFVQYYGLAIQPAAKKPQTRQNVMTKTQHVPQKSSMSHMQNSNHGRLENVTTQSTAVKLNSAGQKKESTGQAMILSNTTLAGIGSTSTRNAAAAMANTGGALVSSNAGKMFDLLESQSGMDFESIGQRSNSHMNIVPSKPPPQNASTATRIASSFQRPGLRAMTANAGRRPLAARRQRQDLDFNGKPECAEERMKEQKLLLFQQKLEANFTRTNQSGFFQKQSEEIQSQQKVKQVATEIAEQAEKNQSSDYNTKAIATRLRSIAQRRIQAANRNRVGKIEVSSLVQPSGAQQIKITSSRNGKPVMMHAKTVDAQSVTLNRLGSQFTELTASQQAAHNPPKSKASIQGAAWVYPNVQTLKATTSENSNKNLLMFGKNQDSVMGLDFSVAAEVNSVPKYSQFAKERMRARSGVLTPSKDVIPKVSDEKRPECQSPFEDIPITSSKKHRLGEARPATGNHQHHYIDKVQAQANLIDKPSAQTLLAFKNQESSIH